MGHQPCGPSGASSRWQAGPGSEPDVLGSGHWRQALVIVHDRLQHFDNRWGARGPSTSNPPSKARTSAQHPEAPRKECCALALGTCESWLLGVGYSPLQLAAGSCQTRPSLDGSSGPPQRNWEVIRVLQRAGSWRSARANSPQLAEVLQFRAALRRGPPVLVNPAEGVALGTQGGGCLMCGVHEGRDACQVTESAGGRREKQYETPCGRADKRLPVSAE